MSLYTKNHASRLQYLVSNPGISAAQIDPRLLDVRADSELAPHEVGVRADAVPALWLGRQLTSRDSRLYTQRMQGLVWQRLIPVDTSIPPWARQHGWEEISVSGEATVLDERTRSSIPLVGESVTEVFATNGTYAVRFHTTRDEIQAASRLGTNLGDFRGRNAAKIIARRIDRTMMLGDPSIKATGFLKINGAELVVPGTKAASGIAWANATGMEIVDDLRRLAEVAFINFGGTDEMRVVIQLAPTRYTMLNRPMTGAGMTATDGGKTIKTYIKENLAHLIDDIISSPNCATAGIGGVHRAMASPRFASDADALDSLFGILPIPLEITAGEWQSGGLVYEQIVMAKCGGVGVREPKLFAYSDGY